MRTVFLTGGTGFIGKQLVKELAKEDVKILTFSKVEKSSHTHFSRKRQLKKGIHALY